MKPPQNRYVRFFNPITMMDININVENTFMSLEEFQNGKYTVVDVAKSGGFGPPFSASHAGSDCPHPASTMAPQRINAACAWRIRMTKDAWIFQDA